jgi:hypothetical protein
MCTNGNGVAADRGTADARERARLAARLKALTEKANAGDEQALRGLRNFLDRHPETWQVVGDLSRAAEAAWLKLLAGDNTLARESVTRRLMAMKNKLAGPHPTPTEELLVNLVAVTHLAHHQAELSAASSPGGSLEQAGFRLKRAESTQRRYERALKLLATLRALLPSGLAPARPLKLHRPAEQRA